MSALPTMPSTGYAPATQGLPPVGRVSSMRYSTGPSDYQGVTMDPNVLARTNFLRSVAINNATAQQASADQGARYSAYDALSPEEKAKYAPAPRTVDNGVSSTTYSGGAASLNGVQSDNTEGIARGNFMNSPAGRAVSAPMTLKTRLQLGVPVNPNNPSSTASPTPVANNGDGPIDYKGLTMAPAVQAAQIRADASRDVAKTNADAKKPGLLGYLKAGGQAVAGLIDRGMKANAQAAKVQNDTARTGIAQQNADTAKARAATGGGGGKGGMTVNQAATLLSHAAEIGIDEDAQKALKAFLADKAKGVSGKPAAEDGPSNPPPSDDGGPGGGTREVGGPPATGTRPTTDGDPQGKSGEPLAFDDWSKKTGAGTRGTQNLDPRGQWLENSKGQWLWNGDGAPVGKPPLPNPGKVTPPGPLGSDQEWKRQEDGTYTHPSRPGRVYRDTGKALAEI